MRSAAVSGVFVTGTDTGVGKTLVSTALLRDLSARGIRSCGMKPVAAGATWRDGALANEDVDALLEAGNLEVPLRLRCPYLFREPASPHISAAFAGQRIDLDHLQRAYAELAGIAEAIVVEGAGGWLAPLSESASIADLAVRLGLPVLLVVGLRLGCLNHALLTASAIAASGLQLVGWVANEIDPDLSHIELNIALLRARIAAPLWAHIRYIGNAAEARSLRLEWPDR